MATALRKKGVYPSWALLAAADRVLISFVGTQSNVRVLSCSTILFMTDVHCAQLPALYSPSSTPGGTTIAVTPQGWPILVFNGNLSRSSRPMILACHDILCRSNTRPAQRCRRRASDTHCLPRRIVFLNRIPVVESDYVLFNFCRSICPKNLFQFPTASLETKPGSA